MRNLFGLLLCGSLMLNSTHVYAEQRWDASVTEAFNGAYEYAIQQWDAGLTEVSIGLELFRWQEFDSGGNRLLTEQGPRVNMRYSRNNESRISSGMLYNINGSLYGGDVEYDGQTQYIADLKNKDLNDIFISSNTDYAGVTGEVNIGYRTRPLAGVGELDLLGGIGIDSWTRTISDGVDARNQRVDGLVEDYKIGFARLAIGKNKQHNFWKGLWRIGVKYPFFTKETLDVPSLELDPGKLISGFFIYRFQLMQNGSMNKGVFVSFIYDGYRFSKSPVVKRFRQPKSNMDIISLSIGMSF